MNFAAGMIAFFGLRKLAQSRSSSDSSHHGSRSSKVSCDCTICSNADRSTAGRAAIIAFNVDAARLKDPLVLNTS